MKNLLFLATIISCLQLPTTSNAQDAVPSEILSRTVAIRTATQQGTAFVIEYGGKLYEITARHLMEGVVEQHPSNVQIRQGSEWKTLPITRILYPASADVDIAILETAILPDRPFLIDIASNDDKSGMMFGQPVWFLGFPFLEGLGTKFRGDKDISIPFIKKGILSAVDASNPSSVLLYIDGFNNHGFSGGPILYYDFGLHKYFIEGVVQGYRYDNAETVVNGKSVQTNVLVNSGILIGYSVTHAIDAIKKASATK